MKKNIILIVTILGFYACKAQQPVFNIYGEGHKAIDFDNAYFKDTENFRDQFVGTWIYTDENTNTTLKVEFQKRDMISFSAPTYNYFDFLVGEFQYIENGVEKANTLSNLNVNHISIWDYSIVGKSKLENYHEPSCNDCPLGAVRLRMRFDEITNDDFGFSADFIIRHIIESGVEKLKVQFVWKNGPSYINKYNTELESTTREHSIPYGNYTLIKE